MTNSESSEHEKELPTGPIDSVTVFAWRKARDLATLSKQVSLEKLVRRAHEGLGHPETSRFIRILKASRATPEVLSIARALKCSICHQHQHQLRAVRHSAPPRENLQFNQLVSVDTVHLRNHKRKPVPSLNVIDYSSHFQMVIPTQYIDGCKNCFQAVDSHIRASEPHLW